MKRIRWVLPLACLGAAAALAASASSLAAESGPKCADIGDPNTSPPLQGETHNYRGTGATGGPPGPYSLAMELLLLAPACKQVTYTVFYIQDTGGNPVAIESSGTSEFGRPQFTATINDDDPTICVFATTASKGGNVHDRAPDTGCLELTAPATGAGAGGFN